MNAVRRQRPSISPDDIDRLLFILEDARNYVVKYGSAQDFNSDRKGVAEKVMAAIDGLADQITGDKHFFHAAAVSATGDKLAYDRAVEKVAKRKRLMGIWLPVRAIKIA